MSRPPEQDGFSEDLGQRELVHSASCGDEGAIERLLEQLLPGLRGYLRNQAGELVAAKESSSDLAQSVCREVLQGLEEGRVEYRGAAEFKQWVYQAARHKILNRNRYYSAGKRDARRERRPGGDADRSLESLAQHDATPSLAVDRDREEQRLRSYLSGLSERDRRVIEMFHFEHRTHEEIAEALDIDAGHSRVILSRALARLTSQWSRDGGRSSGE